MELSGALPIFLCAAFGGMLVELFKWYQLRESDNLPKYAGSAYYWLVTIAMILASGVLGVFYGTTDRGAVMVINIGISAPLIIKAMAETQYRSPLPTDQPDAHQSTKYQALPLPPQAPGFHRDVGELSRPERTLSLWAASTISFLAWK